MKRQGIFLAEAIVGTMLVVAVLGTVIIAVNGQAKLGVKLAARRDAIHRVQASLLQIQSGQKPAANVQLQKLPTTAPVGWRWTAASSEGCTLIGLVSDRSGERVQP